LHLEDPADEREEINSSVLLAQQYLAAMSVNKEFLPYTIFRSNKDQMLGAYLVPGMAKL